MIHDIQKTSSIKKHFSENYRNGKAFLAKCPKLFLPTEAIRPYNVTEDVEKKSRERTLSIKTGGGVISADEKSERTIEKP